MVFVGGAMVSMYIDDPAAEDIRPTKDLDLTFQITTAGKLEEIRQKLLQKGFSQTHEDHVICRFRFDDLLIDVMSTQAVGHPATDGLCQGSKKRIHSNWMTLRLSLCRFPFSWLPKWKPFSIGE